MQNDEYGSSVSGLSVAKVLFVRSITSCAESYPLLLWDSVMFVTSCVYVCFPVECPSRNDAGIQLLTSKMQERLSFMLTPRAAANGSGSAGSAVGKW